MFLCHVVVVAMHLLKQLKLGHAASCHCAGGGGRRGARRPARRTRAHARASRAVQRQRARSLYRRELRQQRNPLGRRHRAARRSAALRRAKAGEEVQVQEQKKNLATSLEVAFIAINFHCMIPEADIRFFSVFQ